MRVVISRYLGVTKRMMALMAVMERTKVVTRPLKKLSLISGRVTEVNTSCAAHAQGVVDALPTPKPSKVLPEREASALLLEDAQGRLLLQKRPPAGIWASLWTLPQADTDAGLREWFAGNIEGNYDHAEALPPIVHTFSHYRLHLQPLHLRKVALRACVGDNDGLRWVARCELDSLGLPAPIRKLLQRHPAR